MIRRSVTVAAVTLLAATAAQAQAPSAFPPRTDPFYLSQTDPSFLYANQLMLGAPPTFGVHVQVGF